MKVMRIPLTGALACLLSGPVMGQEGRHLDGNRLHRFCTSENNLDQEGCTALIIGAMDGFAYGLRIAPAFYGGDIDNPVKLFCLPDGVSYAQSVDVVKKYLNDNPRDRHYLIAELVGMALITAFPCQPA